MQRAEAPPAGSDPTTVAQRLPSKTRRVRARLARRITARPGPIRQVLEPHGLIHRQLLPKADLALLQLTYDIAAETHAHQKRKSGDPYI
ncbi:MAG: GTP pyrophosphokinase, partial [Actinobacteria bacterium]|nr:GTP pyrophosphokinase [Actinomycetota bacterium]